MSINCCKKNSLVFIFPYKFFKSFLFSHNNSNGLIVICPFFGLDFTTNISNNPLTTPNNSFPNINPITPLIIPSIENVNQQIELPSPEFYIYDEENQDEDGGDDAQEIAFVIVAVQQKIRQGIHVGRSS